MLAVARRRTRVVRSARHDRGSRAGVVGRAGALGRRISSFDFVPPELVLAARVYGLGPAEAAQAARLAIAGPGQLSAMAGAVNRTFVQALAIEHERRDRRRP